MRGLAVRLANWWRRRRIGSVEPLPLPPLGAGAGQRFTFATSAYDTPPALLLELAASIAAQNEPGAGWVLVDNGSRNPATIACLDQLGRRPGVRLVREAENRGILGGMHAALRAADREFVLPVDSDDLVAPHTIRAFAHALEAEPQAAFLFSDEDHLTDGRRVNPFHRVGWDPALALACSYIWHLCALHREEALRLGVYADPGANYCHDWDTLLRFVRAGHRPRHVRQVLYSWRTHASSTTNNDQSAHEGSLRSQRHVLQQHLAATGLADRFTVADCPLWRGAPELRLERVAQSLPPVAEARDAESLRRLADSDADALLLRDPRIAIATDDALAECVGWLELLPDVAIVGGRLVDAADRVVSAGYYPSRRGVLAAPDLGRRVADAGYLAMALKPRSVAAVPPGHVLLRRRWLAGLGRRWQNAPSDADAVLPWLCAEAHCDGYRVVCTPFVTGIDTGGVVRAPAVDASPWLAAFSPAGVWFGALHQP